MRFNNKVAIVTGGSNGIGKNITKALSNEGAKVAVIDKDDCNFKCDLFYKGDIADKNVLDPFLDKVINKYGKVDYLINNACLSKRGIISECSYEDFLYVQKIGVIAPYYLSLKLKPYLNNNGSIVNISSTRAFMSQPDTESYSAAKGGITALTHSLATSLKGKVRVNAIAPGWIDNERRNWSVSDYKQHLTNSIGEPEDISNMVLFLCSNEAKFITGQTFIVDGGMTKNMIYHGDNNWEYNAKVSNDGDK
jgi:NAD(P)-dependent dehydrogenase (short-subunit alcohol dehydrogenase family)